MYRKILGSNSCVLRIADNKIISFDPTLPAFQEYATWLADGGELEDEEGAIYQGLPFSELKKRAIAELKMEADKVILATYNEQYQREALMGLHDIVPVTMFIKGIRSKENAGITAINKLRGKKANKVELDKIVSDWNK